MSKIGVILRYMKTMNYQAMFRTINDLHKKTGKSRIWLFADMLHCTRKHGSGYMDYQLFEMYDLTDAQRSTYLTRSRNNAIVKQYNDPEYTHYFHNKSEFNTKFAKYIKRDWALMENKDQAISFLRKHSQFLIKPIAASCGVGIHKAQTADYGSPEQAYDAILASDGQALLEEIVVQHPAVAAIYPGSVNTVRAVTLLKDGIPKVVGTFFRIGNHGKLVDNLNNGGMVVLVDENNGHISMRAMDKEKNIFTHHPSTGTAIQGYTFPDWEAAMDMVREAALVVPQIGYVGWDIAFTENGPLLIEGNDYPGYDLQLPEFTPDKIGFLPKYGV